MRVFAGILIILVTLVVYLRIRAGKRRDRKLDEAAEAAAAAATAKSAAGRAGGANAK
jgi:hypothetical protein